MRHTDWKRIFTALTLTIGLTWAGLAGAETLWDLKKKGTNVSQGNVNDDAGNPRLEGIELNATDAATGTLPDARLSGNVTTEGNTFNGANQLIQLDGSGNYPALDGSAITNVTAVSDPQIGISTAALQREVDDLNASTTTLQGNIDTVSGTATDNDTRLDELAISTPAMQTEIDANTTAVAEIKVATTTIDHGDLSNVTANQHHTPTVDTNAGTQCAAGEYLDGDTTCIANATQAELNVVDGTASDNDTRLDEVAVSTPAMQIEIDANTTAVAEIKVATTSIDHGDLSNVTANQHHTPTVDTFVTNLDAHNHLGGDGGTIAHTSLNTVGTSDHHVQTVNTDAESKCASGEYLEGDGTCDTLATGSDRVLRTGDNMTGQLTLESSSITVQGNALFRQGDSIRFLDGSGNESMAIRATGDTIMFGDLTGGTDYDTVTMEVDAAQVAEWTAANANYSTASTFSSSATIAGLLVSSGEIRHGGIIKLGGMTQAQIRAFVPTEHADGSVFYKVENLDDQDVYTSTGAIVGSFRSQRLGIEP